MRVEDVPQQDNAALGGGRKAMYARDEQGRVVVVASTGWEVEEIVTLQAVDNHRRQAERALAAARLGQASSLEYWMYERRMDLPMLAESVGLWRWRVKRHLKPAVFLALSAPLLHRYAEALGMSVEELCHLPK